MRYAALVAKRIEELQVRNEGKAEVAALKKIIIEQLRAGYAELCAPKDGGKHALCWPVHQHQSP